MKKLLIPLLLLCFVVLIWTSSTGAWNPVVVSSGVSAAGGYSLEQDLPATKDNVENVSMRPGFNDANHWNGGCFTTGGSGYTITRFDVQIGNAIDVGNSSIVWQVELYSANFGSSLQTANETIDLDVDQPTTDEWLEFTITGESLSASTEYCVAFKNTGTNDSADYATIRYDSTDTQTVEKTDDSPVSWSNIDGTSQMYLKTYSGGS